MDATTLQTLLGAGGVPVIVGVVELVKQTVDLPAEQLRRLTPLVTLVVSAGWNLLVIRLLTGLTPDPYQAAFYTIAATLAAMGLWSGGKALAGR